MKLINTGVCIILLLYFHYYTFICATEQVNTLEIDQFLSLIFKALILTALCQSLPILFHPLL